MPTTVYKLKNWMLKKSFWLKTPVISGIKYQDTLGTPLIQIEYMIVKYIGLICCLNLSKIRFKFYYLFCSVLWEMFVSLNSSLFRYSENMIFFRLWDKHLCISKLVIGLLVSLTKACAKVLAWSLVPRITKLTKYPQCLRVPCHFK